MQRYELNYFTYDISRFNNKICHFFPQYKNNILRENDSIHYKIYCRGVVSSYILSKTLNVFFFHFTGIEYLCENHLLRMDAQDIAHFLYKGEGLNKTAIGTI